jgi:hypothetical protein
VPRPGTRVQYHLGKDGGVGAIAIGLPYEPREQLLGSRVALFGSYARRAVQGTAANLLDTRPQMLPRGRLRVLCGPCGYRPDRLISPIGGSSHRGPRQPPNLSMQAIDS